MSQTTAQKGALCGLLTTGIITATDTADQLDENLRLVLLIGWIVGRIFGNRL
jgi:hypothetical protein